MKTSSNAAAAEALAEEEALRKRAARQAVTEAAEAQSLPLVTVRVLKLGDGRVSMGKHVDGTGEAHYERNETFRVRSDIAAALEDRGFVEIVEDEPAKA